jgi:hypothetical protein
MTKAATKTPISLRGSLCRDLLEMVASGDNAADAAAQLISELLNSADGRFSIHRVGEVFVIERRDEVSSHSPPMFFQ